MKQTLHTMLGSHTLQGLHYNLIVVNLHICFRINRRKLMLCRSSLIMLGFRSNTKLPQFFIHMLHISRNSLTDGSKIVVIQLLSFWRHGAKQCSSGKYQVFSLAELFFTDQEIFLFCANRWNHTFCCGISKQTNQTESLGINGLHGTQKWCFLVQGLSCIGTKGSRNAQGCPCCIVTHKSRRGTIPGSIPSRLKGSTKSTRGEGRGVRFSCNQFLSGKAHQNFSIWKRSCDKRIVFLRSHSCQRLKPVGVMGSALFNGPFLHLMSNDICHFQR